MSTHPNSTQAQPGHATKSSPAKANTSPRKFTKRGISNSPCSLKSGSSTSVLEVYVLKTRSDDMIARIERSNGTPPYLVPTIHYVNGNVAFSRETLHVDVVKNRVATDNPDEHMNSPSQTGYLRTFPLMIYIVPETLRDQNTPANRIKWGQHLVNFLNHRANQSKYTYPMEARFGGDITPQDESQAPYMSDYLTTRDTMDVMRDALSSTPGQAPSIGDVLDMPEAMAVYYSPAALNHAQDFFQAYRNHIPGRVHADTNSAAGGNDNTEHDNFSDLGTFQMA